MILIPVDRGCLREVSTSWQYINLHETSYKATLPGDVVEVNLQVKTTRASTKSRGMPGVPIPTVIKDGAPKFNPHPQLPGRLVSSRSNGWNIWRGVQNSNHLETGIPGGSNKGEVPDLQELTLSACQGATPIHPG